MQIGEDIYGAIQPSSVSKRAAGSSSKPPVAWLPEIPADGLLTAAPPVELDVAARAVRIPEPDGGIGLLVLRIATNSQPSMRRCGLETC
jgi:hypothetical protein